MKTEIRVNFPAWTDDIQLMFRVTGNDGRHSLVEPLTLKTLEPGEMAQPTLSISRVDGQQWIDELWRAGLRPSEGSGSAGSLAATERHLADMKAIAFGALRKTGIDAAK